MWKPYPGLGTIAAVIGIMGFIAACPPSLQAQSRSPSPLGGEYQRLLALAPRPAPAQGGQSGAASADRARRLRDMYQRQDETERLRERLKRIRARERGVATAPNLMPGHAPVNLGAYREDFQPRPSLNPVTVRSVNKRLDLILSLDYHIFDIGKDKVRLRSYNKGLVGPVLRAKPGDVLRIVLLNRLPLDSQTPHGVNGHHDWNTTNLHFHGLHVAPQGPVNLPDGRSDKESDNVLLELKPSLPFDPKVSVQKYEVRIPDDHPAGTFWYHAHKHGAVAAQVSSGLAGALIIERDDETTNLDCIPEIKAAAQEVLVLQQIPYASNVFGTLGGIEPTSPDAVDDMFGPGQWPTLKRYALVNGLRIPTITMAPGEIRRFRLVDSGQRELMALRIEPDDGSPNPGSKPLAMHEIALDGLATGSIVKKEEIELFPGYRSDVLVQAPIDASGEYHLVDSTIVDRTATGADGSFEPVRWVAKIVVTGQPVKMALPRPEQLIRQRLKDINPSDATGTRYAFYGIHFPPSAAPDFLISRDDLNESAAPVDPSNAQPYTPGQARRLDLGQTERWLIGSRNGGIGAGSPLAVTHPFHIHINPFLITKVTKRENGVDIDVTKDEIGGPVWRDTLAMKQGLTYETLTRYDDFAGSFVDHCHILDHEDSGMMELVTIVDAKIPAAAQASRNRVSADQAPGRDVGGGEIAPARAVKNRISASIPPNPGKPVVLFFVKGAFCQHCMAQLNEMAARLAGQDLAVSVISASTTEDLNEFPPVPFTLVADPDLEVFRKFGAFDGEAKHATIAFDAAGKEVFRNVGDAPLTDAAPVLRALRLDASPSNSVSASASASK